MTAIPARFHLPAMLLVLAIGAGLGVWTMTSATAANGGPGFPLDDAWIHLQFARTLQETGTFSYFREEMPTSGSTSPLFTLLLALGFFLPGDGVTAGQIAGLLFLLAGAYVFHRLAAREFHRDVLPALGAGLLFVLEPRLLWASLSGMETTLFIATTLAGLWFYRARRPLLTGAAAGLALWARPEGIAFAGLLALEAVLHSIRHREKPRSKRAPRTPLLAGARWLTSALATFLPLAAGYAGFNLVLSGSVFPNTFAAKTRYYAGGGEGYAAAVLRFLSDGHMLVAAPFLVIGILVVIVSFLRRREDLPLTTLLWPVFLIAAYGKNLPFLYQEGRYLMPLLPFVILLVIRGIMWTVDRAVTLLGAHRRAAARIPAFAAVLLVLLVQSGRAAADMQSVYTESCRYIGDRQVATGRWLNRHLPPSSVIGTHDIGAVAFYSRMRIADMVGLVSPEMIPNIGRFDLLNGFLLRQNVTHLAVLRNWFEIDNQRLVFHTDERFPEIMEVWEFDPARVHYVPQGVTRLLDAAEAAVARNDMPRAIGILREAIRQDPLASRGHVLLSRIQRAAGRMEEAEASARHALELRPGNREARLELAQIALSGERRNEARDILQGVLREYPDFTPARELVKGLP